MYLGLYIYIYIYIALFQILMFCCVFPPRQVWCRTLNAAAKYFRSVTFIAIFAEGLYLHRRISRVLYVSRREPLLKYFLISWGEYQHNTIKVDTVIYCE